MRKPLHPARRYSQRGFSLIELLIVVAVIGILAALSIPAVNRAIAKSKDTQCLANLRAVGTAFQGFVNDNGSLPAIRNDDTNSSSWSLMLINQIGMKFPGINEKNVFRCPSADYPDHKSRRTYAMCYSSDEAISETDRKAQKFKLSQFTKPSMTALVIDCAGSVSDEGDGEDSFDLASYSSVGDWRHSDALNVLCVDGHVEKFGDSDYDRLEEYVSNFGQ